MNRLKEIKALVNKTGWTGKIISQKSGVHLSTVEKVKAGKMADPEKVDKILLTLKKVLEKLIRGLFAIGEVMGKTFLFIALLFFVGCTNEQDALRVLKMDGVTDIQMTGYKWFACSKDDWYHTGFQGRRNGQLVEGVVCSGLIFKSSTVRY